MLLTKYRTGYQTKDDEIGRTWGTFGEKDLDVDTRIILKCTENKYDGMAWIEFMCPV